MGWLVRLFCPHTRMFSMTIENVWKAKCFKCGYESPGVEVGGFRYSKEKPERICTRACGIREAFKPRRVK